MDSYPRCATCRHWEEPPPYEPVSLSGWCKALTEQDDMDNGLIVTSSDYSIYTSAEFGCVLHEPKES